MSDDLIKLIQQDDKTLVSGRDLHNFLGVNEKYTQWFKRMVDYGFAENVDFSSLSDYSEKPQGGRPSINHALTLDMAKEVAMIQRTDKGKEAREYFIKVEKSYHKLNGSDDPVLAQLQLLSKVRQDQLAQEKKLKSIETQQKSLHDTVQTIVTKDEQLKGIADFKANRSFLDEAKKIVRFLADKKGNYKAVYTQIYQQMRENSHIDINRRFKNFQYRLRQSGVTESTVQSYSKLYMIASDDFLRVAFANEVENIILELGGRNSQAHTLNNYLKHAELNNVFD